MPDRPIFTPVFEEDESVIRDRMLNRISDDWRKEPGDYIYDTVAASPLEVKQEQIQLDSVLKNSFAQYAEGEYLDLKLSEIGLTRIPATANKRALTVTADAGVHIPQGQVAFSLIVDGEGNPYEFTVDAAVSFTVAGDKTVNLTCKTVGAVSNLPTGTQFIFQPSIPGIRLIVDAGTTIPAADKESDIDAWTRYDFKIKNPDTGGNKNDYVRWTREVTGVGKAKCIPRWNGNGTVKVVVAGADLKPASPALVSEVQTYLDPGMLGLGEGKAPCGASVTAIAATGVDINVAATVTYYAGAEAAAKAAFNAAMDAYFASIAFVEIVGDANHNNIPVSIAKIGALLVTTEGVSNYSGLTLNGGAVDVAIPTASIAVRGTVTI